MEIFSAKAHTNIALIKYWGKRDEGLILPMNSSLSLTLDGFYTKTHVIPDLRLSDDQVWLDGAPAPDDFAQKVKAFMHQVRKQSALNIYAQIDTENHVPLAAGLASSASGFAALATAASKAYGLSMDPKALSILARMGSGSAARSIFGGFVKWHKGHLEDGSDSYGQCLLEKTPWMNEICMVAVLVSQDEKHISSRRGMALTVKTSPLYKGWLESVEEDLEIAQDCIKREDLKTLGEVMEHNALKMHATMLASKPSVQYMNKGTLAVMACVYDLRSKGLLAYFTMDAGPNVKILCYREDAPYIQSALERLKDVEDIVLCSVGGGVE